MLYHQKANSSPVRGTNGCLRSQVCNSLVFPEVVSWKDDIGNPQIHSRKRKSRLELELGRRNDTQVSKERGKALTLRT